MLKIKDKKIYIIVTALVVLAVFMYLALSALGLDLTNKDVKISQWCMIVLSVLLLISFLMLFSYNKRSQFFLVESEVNKKLEDKAKTCREYTEFKAKVCKELTKSVSSPTSTPKTTTVT